MVLLNSLMASLHHLAAFALTACLVYEFIAYRKGLTISEARNIQRMDIAYGVSAGVLLIVGLLRVFFFEKGANYYAHNTLFWVKMGLFVTVGLLSVYPTMRFIRWSDQLNSGNMPVIPEDEFKRIRILLSLELLSIVLILFAAPAMARAIGM